MTSSLCGKAQDKTHISAPPRFRHGKKQSTHRQTRAGVHAPLRDGLFHKLPDAHQLHCRHSRAHRRARDHQERSRAHQHHRLLHLRRRAARQRVRRGQNLSAPAHRVRARGDFCLQLPNERLREHRAHGGHLGRERALSGDVLAASRQAHGGKPERRQLQHRLRLGLGRKLVRDNRRLSRLPAAYKTRRLAARLHCRRNLRRPHDRTLADRLRETC